MAEAILSEVLTKPEPTIADALDLYRQVFISRQRVAALAFAAFSTQCDEEEFSRSPAYHLLELMTDELGDERPERALLARLEQLAQAEAGSLTKENEHE